MAALQLQEKDALRDKPLYLASPKMNRGKVHRELGECGLQTQLEISKLPVASSSEHAPAQLRHDRALS